MTRDGGGCDESVILVVAHPSQKLHSRKKTIFIMVTSWSYSGESVDVFTLSKAT